MREGLGGAFSRAIAAVLFISLAAYLTAGVGVRLNREIRWEQVSERNVERFFLAEGIVIRREIPTEGGSAAEGRRLGAGDSMGEGFFAPASGIYFSSCDGYEHLSPEDIPLLSSQDLSRLCSQTPEKRETGRLITGNRWYFVFSSPSASGLEAGSEVVLDFGLGELPCIVELAGEAITVLRMDTQLAQHAHLRIAQAKIICESYSGLALSLPALRQDEGGYFVWAITAGRLEKKIIEVIFIGEDFVLAQKGSGAAGLQDGDKLVCAGDDLYEGKIIL